MHDDLLNRIQRFEFDEGSPVLSFARRLARENGWTLEYAGRVLEEYKKFMFLAVAAGHPVTPSEQVDQAWHLHLVYTRSYWQDFCEQVLGTQVQHGPTKGGTEEQVKYRDWYQRTKASYARLLGETPPEDIWPHVDVRFDQDLCWQRVNMRRNWVIAKPSVRHWLLAGFVLPVMFLGIWIMYCQSGPTLPNVISQLFSHASSMQSITTLGLISSHQPMTFLAQTAPQLRRVEDKQVRAQSTVNNHIVMWFIFGFVFLIYISYSILFGGRCSSCGRVHAMEKTGQSQKGEAWLSSTEYEWKCKYCGATKWEEAGSGGCGGCGGGGCGGCGGCGG